jgi:cytochrome oxidase Cu insertion factor (SCO1/SenC/PrrC family)
MMRNMQISHYALLAKVTYSITLCRPMRKTDIENQPPTGMEPAVRDPAKLRKTAFFIVLFAVISAVVVLWNYSIAAGKQNTSDRPAYHGNVFFNLKFLRQDGKTCGFDDLKGKIWIIQPCSVTQPATCALSTTALQRLRVKYQDNADVAFVSLVIDPGPAEGALKMLQQAAEQQSAKLPQWWFGTTEPAVLHKYLKDKCRLGMLPHIHEGTWVYDSSLIVVDRDMKLRRAVIPQQKGGRPYVTGFDFAQAAEWDKEGKKTGTENTNQEEMQSLLEKTIERLLAVKPIDAAP